METELKICPFCGAKPEITDIARTRGGLAGWVTCPDCFCEGPATDVIQNKGECVAAWNRRAAPEPAPGDMERARKALDDFISGFCEEAAGMSQDEEISALAAEFAMVRAEATKAERERCARVCEEVENEKKGIGSKVAWDFGHGAGIAAAAIRKGEP